ncbi:galanin receptor type 1-like [Ylistrum balloti]|uniref:galanin receptor type 1-like n=1 Tax=Ylistrum balloti TaxID=509963 RepID=UPI002905CC72|nr:galanin receptor type 1-like [Ylistrum balloti]
MDDYHGSSPFNGDFDFYAENLFQNFNESTDDLMNLNYTFVLESEADVTERRIVPLVFLVIFIVGILGNAMVIFVFLRNKAFRTITNIYLLNLAVVDLLYLCLCVPFTAVFYWISYWPFGNTLCKLASYLMVCCMSLHVMTLTAIGIDRYMAVVHPVMSRTLRTKNRTLRILVAIWFISITAFSPVIRITREIVSFKTFCMETLEKAQMKIYVTMLFIFMYAIPLFILGFCYIEIARKMRTISSVGLRFNQMRIATIQTRQRILKVFFVVTLTFAICWLPLHVAAIMDGFGMTNNQFLYYVKIYSPCFSYSTTATNPVIYCFVSKTFRKFCKATFICENVNINTMLFGEEGEVMSNLPRTRRREQRELLSLPPRRDNVNGRQPLFITVRPADLLYTQT